MTTSRGPLIRRWLVEQVAAELGEEPATIARDVPLRQLGFDSLEIMDLIQSIERDHGVQLYPAVLSEQATLESLAEHLAAGTAGTTIAGALAPGAAAGPGALPVPGSSPGLRNPPAAFILSAPRSGSTLLRVMLAGHPQLFAPPELNLLAFAGMQERRQALPAARLDEGLLRALMQLQGTDARASRAQLEAMVADDLSVQQVYARLQELAGDRLLVDKSPLYASLPGALARAEELFAAPRYVFLTRHPHGAVESFVRNRFDVLYRDFARVLPPVLPDALELAQQHWATANGNVLAFLAGLDDRRVLRLRFEDLVRDPRRAAETLCGFLGVELDEAVLRPYAGERMAHGMVRGSAALGDPGFLTRSGIDRTLADSWRQVVLPRPLGAAARCVADELGYPIPRPRQPVAAVPPRRVGGFLVPLQPQGSGPPLVLVHPASGALYPYYELVNALGIGRPLYGLQDVTPAAGRPSPATIDEYAALYVDAIRVAQPCGPYLLGGWSFGGHVAMAIARRLRAAGEAVALVVLLDCEAPVNQRSLSLRQRLGELRNWGAASLHGFGDLVSYARDGLYMVRTVDRHRHVDARRDPTRRPLRWPWQSMWDRRLARDARIRRVLASYPQFAQVRLPRETVRATLAAFVHHLTLLHAEVPRPYEGDVALLRAREQAYRSFARPAALGWDELVRGRLEVHDVDGNHMTLCQEPHVHGLAATINDCIARALDPDSNARAAPGARAHRSAHRRRGGYTGGLARRQPGGQQGDEQQDGGGAGVG